MKGLDKAYIQCDFVFCRFQYLQQTDHNIAEADKHSGQKQTPLERNKFPDITKKTSLNWNTVKTRHFLMGRNIPLRIETDKTKVFSWVLILKIVPDLLPI